MSEHSKSGDKMTNSASQQEKVEKENLHAEMVIELDEQIDELKQQCQSLQKELFLYKASVADYLKEIKGLKYDNKRMQMEARDNRDRYEQALKAMRERQEMKDKEMQLHFGTLKNASVQYKQKYESEMLKHSAA